MGLFDFARNIGKKIFSNDDEAAEKLKAHIEADNPGMKDLTVEYTDGVAKISGQAKDSAALEKAVLMAGNVEGVGEVQLGEVSGAEPSENVSYYEIQSGDSLWKIAEKAYGNGSQYTKIFEENKEVIKDPDLIYPGQKIRIPNA
ncbi:peptidoglycan-binding protein LysM [Ostreibacterium oceani]|uniref:Peptidoglycan-binding protein LysM n=1 Tax=Ostreibacterium oceani TaxID=2654998 RepID=A0A6N7ETF8_9GAMM|nr:peptidoglycan-binding protein LysM [Ostreibacterium oceani]MPV85841.1 peptidoglycan-binding protein LysM [Ostreibacterium oceani]